jgi:Tfp pilus assembly protein FimV
LVLGDRKEECEQGSERINHKQVEGTDKSGKSAAGDSTAVATAATRREAELEARVAELEKALEEARGEVDMHVVRFEIRWAGG